MSSPSSSRNGRLSTIDSPSRQLLDEWAQARITVVQHRKRLELATAEKAAEHRAALAIAAAEHHKVYLSAVQTQEYERLARENAERQRLLAEKEARDLEEAKRAELARREEESVRTARERAEREREERQREQEKRRHEEQEREKKRQEQQREEERRRLEESKQEEQKREKERLEEENRRKQEQNAVQKTQPNGVDHTTQARPSSPPTFLHKGGSVTSSLSEKERNHKKYLDLHQRLKGLRQRKDVKELIKQRDWEREMRKKVNQISADKNANRIRKREITKILQDAIQITQLTVDAREYIINPLTPWPAETTSFQISAVFVCLVNSFAKKCITKFAEDRNSAYNPADVVGVLISTVFSDPTLQFQDNSFVDILLAKYHKVCPVLWGVYGPENTVKGRERLGWRKIEGEYITQQEHYDRMGGFGAGWAALTLRDYSKVKSAKMKNPLPAWHYWQAMSCILNVPPQERTQTHLVVLKGLVEQYVPLFVKFYGQAACVVLRKALVEYPEATQKSPASEALKALRETIRQKYHLPL